MTGWTPQRPEPNLPAGAYQSYEIKAPKATHWRKATCQEIGCEPYLHGWRTVVDERTEQGMAQAYYIRKQSARRAAEERNEHGQTVFTFEAGQACFASGDDTHRIQIRRELYLVRGGDWRANTGLITRHSGARDWVDDFGEHQDNLAAQIQKG